MCASTLFIILSCLTLTWCGKSKIHCLSHLVRIDASSCIINYPTFQWGSINLLRLTCLSWEISLISYQTAMIQSRIKNICFLFWWVWSRFGQDLLLPLKLIIIINLIHFCTFLFSSLTKKSSLSSDIIKRRVKQVSYCHNPMHILYQVSSRRFSSWPRLPWTNKKQFYLDKSRFVFNDIICNDCDYHEYDRKKLINKKHKKFNNRYDSPDYFQYYSPQRYIISSNILRHAKEITYDNNGNNSSQFATPSLKCSNCIECGEHEQ